MKTLNRSFALFAIIAFLDPAMVAADVSLPAVLKNHMVLQQPYSGPIYESMSLQENQIRIRFTHTNGGLATEGNHPVKGFAIAGLDSQFVWADASIEGNSILVSHASISNPIAVRYAWANNPACNLYNGAGLPASPFRTDSWPGVTSEKR